VGRVRIQVSASGPGSRPEWLERIFDPFFMTCSHGGGTGNCLAICHSIIADHRGTITVEREVGEGSTCRLGLPAAPSEGQGPEP
jgi:signal transduction histidine kinase